MPDTQQFVAITPVAAEEVKKLISQENKPGIGLRLGVKGGGCSGLSYDLGFTQKTTVIPLSNTRDSRCLWTPKA